MLAVRPARLVPYLAALLGSLYLAGCAGAPVQEMSDARQAVRAAEEAGAEQKAPEQLAAAQALLKEAEGNINRGEYREARDHATRARMKAIEARKAATRNTGQTP
jgi:hypothetical protein